MKQIILAFAGKKQSGKDSAGNFLVRNASELFGEDIVVKKFAFADPLKELCHIVMGLTFEQCWGTDEQKNTLTRYQWESLPHYGDLKQIAYAKADELASKEIDPKQYDLWYSCFSKYKKENLPTGLMTARQVLQEIGTSYRKMWSDIWASACISKIRQSDANVAVICDTRFPNEVNFVQNAQKEHDNLLSKVIRLTRDVYKGQDQHISETALDGFEGFDHVLVNDEMTLSEQHKATVELLKKWGLIK